MTTHDLPAQLVGTRPAGRSPRGVVAASSIGTGLEFYDFFLYGTASALGFGPDFPFYSPPARVLASFATSLAAASPEITDGAVRP